MATITIKDQTLCVNVEGLDKVFALRSSITVPLAHVVSVTARPDISKVMYMPVGSQFRGVRHTGLIVAGTLLMADGSGNVFCDVHDDKNALVIELQHDEFKRIIIELSDQTPEQARDMIEAAIGHRTPDSEAVEEDRQGDEPRPDPEGTNRVRPTF
jgi:hypothetical protein